MTSPGAPLYRPPRNSVVFAVPSSLLNRPQVQEVFRDSGLRPIFADSSRELDDLAGNPSVGLVFVDLLFGSDPISQISRLRRRGNVIIMVLAEQLSIEEQSALKQRGVLECLFRPVHALSLLERAKLALLPQVQTGQKTWATGLPPKSEVAAADPRFPGLENIETWVKAFDRVARPLGGDVILDRKLWPAPSSLVEKPLAYSDILSKTEGFLSTVSRVTKAGRCTLLSLRPDSLSPIGECPTRMRLLASSEVQIPRKDSAVPTVLFPQIVLVARRGEALFIPQSAPSLMAGIQRPKEWMLRDRVESSSAVIPLFEGKRLFSAVLCQFENFDIQLWPLLEQSRAFFQRASSAFAQLDFLSRVYAQKT